MIGFEEIERIVEARMANWGDAPVAYDGWQNSPKLQAAIDSKESWVRLTINHGESFAASVSDRPETRRTGLVMIQVFTPEHRGSHPAALLADSLAEHLEYYRDGHFETQAASVQRVGPDDGWYQYYVTLPFRAGC